MLALRIDILDADRSFECVRDLQIVKPFESMRESIR